MKTKLAVLTCLALAAPAVAGLDVPEGELGIRALSATGQTIQGQIVHANDAALRLLADGESVSLPKANIVRFDLELSEPLEAYVAPASEDTSDYHIAVGRICLARDLPFLAHASFAKALADKRTSVREALRKRIVTSYERAKVDLPKSFGGQADNPLSDRLFPTVTEAQMTECLQLGRQWATQMEKLAPGTHEIRTEHFLVYSTLPKTDDRPLKGVFDNAYKSLCKQFDVPDDEHVWAGPLVVFIFTEDRSYEQFCRTVAGIPAQVARASSAVAVRRGEFQGLLLGPLPGSLRSRRDAQRAFFEVLIHETTHAFLARYITKRPLPNWLEEGVCETFCRRLVNRSAAGQKMRMAHKAVRRGGRPDIEALMSAKNIPLKAEAYGLVQSMVQYLVQADGKAFIALVRDLKRGKDFPTALQEHYDWTQAKYLERWMATIR